MGSCRWSYKQGICIMNYGWGIYNSTYSYPWTSKWVACKELKQVTIVKKPSYLVCIPLIMCNLSSGPKFS